MKDHFNLSYAVIVLSALILNSSSTLHAADLEKGKAKFATLCATCHGALGAGDGPVAAAMPADQKPANFATGKMKFAIDEVKFKELLLKGGAAVGLSPMMPPQAGLNDADIADLYAFVKSLHKN